MRQLRSSANCLVRCFRKKSSLTEKNIELTTITRYSTLSSKKPTSYEGTKKKKVRNLRRFLTQYPDRESNSELSFRRALLYPFNYQGLSLRRHKGTEKRRNYKIIERVFSISATYLEITLPYLRISGTYFEISVPYFCTF